MNRERLLFVVVVGIVALWYFVMREPPAPRDDVRAGVRSLELLPVRGSSLTQPPLKIPSPPPFTLVTNETPHPRPIDDPVWTPEPRDLPNVWPPTSRTVATHLLGRLRRAATQRAMDDAASIQLPEAAAGGGNGGDAAPTVERLDKWDSYNRRSDGQVMRIKAKGKWISPPKEFPKPGEFPEFYRLLLLLEIDPDRAANQEGVTDVNVRISVGSGGSRVDQAFPGVINNFRIALKGKQQGWMIGARTFLRTGSSADALQRSAARLLEDGRQRGNDLALIGWAMFLADKARPLIPESAQNATRDVLLLQLAGANLLNRQERVLELGFEHLAKFQQDSAVLEYMGNILSSRSYGLLELAAVCYERASKSRTAQRSRAGLLIQLGRHEEARQLLDSGAAGGGSDVDLLRARVALSLGDYETASSRANRLAGGSGATAAEAYQILGGIEYAQGNAAAAQAHFMEAVQADPGRSTAYSDLGLALVVQGKLADAQLCFARARALDFENSIIPRLGLSYGKITFALGPVMMDKNPRLRDPKKIEAQETAKTAAMKEAIEELDELQNDNPNNLLVRFYRAYAKEKTDDLSGASQELRTILDEDHRYRVAIARLGIVEATIRERGGPKEHVRPAIAHLLKAVELNPKDATANYILARFLMLEDVRRKQASEHFGRVESLPPPPGDEDLPLWAKASNAALLYRDESVEERRVRAAFEDVIELVRKKGARTGATDTKGFVAAHPVGQYAVRCRDLVVENARKVDTVWQFKTEPKDWLFHRKLPMRVGVTRNGLEFRGTVDFKGNPIDHTNRLEFCCAEYKRGLNSSDFFELHVKGEIPANMQVGLGIGLVGMQKTRRLGRRGVQILRDSDDRKVSIRLDGGSEIDIFKRDRASTYVPTEVAWPTGEFTLVIRVHDRKKGLVAIELNGKNVTLDQWQLEAVRASMFGATRKRPMSVVMWIEGRADRAFRDIVIKEVRLVRAGQ